MKYDQYQKFRQETYLMLGKAKDAAFELMDSIMTTRNATFLERKERGKRPIL